MMHSKSSTLLEKTARQYYKFSTIKKEKKSKK